MTATALWPLVKGLLAKIFSSGASKKLLAESLEPLEARFLTAKAMGKIVPGLEDVATEGEMLQSILPKLQRIAGNSPGNAAGAAEDLISGMKGARGRGMIRSGVPDERAIVRRIMAREVPPNAAGMRDVIEGDLIDRGGLLMKGRVYPEDADAGIRRAFGTMGVADERALLSPQEAAKARLMGALDDTEYVSRHGDRLEREAARVAPSRGRVRPQRATVKETATPPAEAPKTETPKTDSKTGDAPQSWLRRNWKGIGAIGLPMALMAGTMLPGGSEDMDPRMAALMERDADGGDSRAMIQQAMLMQLLAKMQENQQRVGGGSLYI